MPRAELLTIGEVASRAGVATSALRFYEDVGLIRSQRSGGGARRYPRSTLRLVAVIQAAKAVGLPLADIKVSLDTLPDGRTPTKADWARLSRTWRERLAAELPLAQP